MPASLIRPVGATQGKIDRPERHRKSMTLVLMRLYSETLQECGATGALVAFLAWHPIRDVATASDNTAYRKQLHAYRTSSPPIATTLRRSLVQAPDKGRPAGR